MKYDQVKSSNTEVSREINEMENDMTTVTTISVGVGNITTLTKVTPENKQDASNGKGTDATVYFDPNSSGHYRGDGVEIDPASSLAHELAHAYDITNGEMPDPSKSGNKDKAEASATERENEYRASQGLQQRTKYGDVEVKQNVYKDEADDDLKNN
jgi:hypothetical protein